LRGGGGGGVRHFEKHNAYNNGHYNFNHVSITETLTLHEGKITSRNVLFDYTPKSANVFPSLRNVVSSGHHDLICLFVCLFYWVGRNGSFSWLVNSICVDSNLECVCNFMCNLITQLLRGKLGVSNFMCNLIA